VVKAIDVQTNEAVNVYPDTDGALVALAFKITDEETGQLTYAKAIPSTIPVLVNG
jgi:elongation factor G